MPRKIAGQKTIVSRKFSLNSEDIKKWGRNALIFSGPAILVFLGSVAGAIPQDWKYGAVALYAINVIIDLFRKWLNENKY